MAMQVIEQGPRNLVIKFDGAGPHTVDVSALSPPCEEVRITKIIYDNPGDGSLTLTWDATADVLAWQSNGYGETHCFQSFGGLVNNSAAGKTGDVVYAGVADGNAVVCFKKIRTAPVL